jgi:putative endonuclease
MASHNDLGKIGEEMGAKWLTEKGYSILHRNWKYGQLEIDVIATRGEYLHFIEIKTRKHGGLGHPEDSVTRSKFKGLQRAANAFLFRYPGHTWIQYDVLAITLLPKNDCEYFLIEDVYL